MRDFAHSNKNRICGRYPSEPMTSRQALKLGAGVFLLIVLGLITLIAVLGIGYMFPELRQYMR